MHSSKLPLRTWGLALYILKTGLKGTSSMKLHRDLGTTQKAAWHVAHRKTHPLTPDVGSELGTMAQAAFVVQAP